jgi:cytidylate kinase
MKKAGESHDASHLVERQMLLSHVKELAGHAPADPMRPEGHRFLTITRAVGSLGDEVAAELAVRLQWHLYDREIVDAIARDSHVRQDLVRDLDERSQSLIHDTVARLLFMAAGISFGNEEYHEALLKTLALLAARGRAVILGRGSAHALQGEPGLHLRFVASPEVRIERVARQYLISPEEARRRMEKIDAERRSFIQHHFRQNVDDLHFYDAVFNSDHMSVAQVVQAVMGLIQVTAPSIWTESPVAREAAEPEWIVLHAATPSPAETATAGKR